MVWTLGEIARNTGGDIRGIGVIGESTTAIDEVIRLFRESYVLSYRATGVEMPGWHDIRVRVASRGGVAIRARRGYFVNDGGR